VAVVSRFIRSSAATILVSDLRKGTALFSRGEDSWDSGFSDGLHSPVAAGAEGDGEHCSKFRSDAIRNGTSCGAKWRQAMRSNPSLKPGSQLSEQIHLGGIGRFDGENRGGGCGSRLLRVPVEEVLQFLEILLQRIEQVALV
jgi:hypothetical protein